MKKIIVFIAIGLFLTLPACHRNRPEPFLDENQMCGLLTEIRLTEAVMYNHRTAEASCYSEEMIDRSLAVYEPIFQKYGISYDQYMALMKYYMQRPEKLKAVYAKSADSLKKMLEEKEAETTCSAPDPQP